jgi:hypothetical protein
MPTVSIVSVPLYRTSRRKKQNLSKNIALIIIVNIKMVSQTLSSIDIYMKRKSIKPELQTRIREYLKFIWRERQTLNVEEEQKIINCLPNSLKEELMVNAYGFFLKNNPLFTKSFSENSLRKLVSVMKEISLTPDDVIYSVKK